MRTQITNFCCAILIGVLSAQTYADSVVAWGANYYGQLGNGTTTNSSSPVFTSSLGNNVSAVSGGASFSIAVQNGAAYAWGLNLAGALGTGLNSNSLTPVPVAGMTSGVTNISAGGLHSLAVRDGVLYAWGNDNSGQLGDGRTGTYSTTPIAVPGFGSGVSAIAAGAYSCVVVRNGAAYAWGDNTYGQLGNGTLSSTGLPGPVIGLSSGVTAVAAGDYTGLAVKDGALYQWGKTEGASGYDTIATPFQVSGMSSGVTGIASGGFHNLALKNGNVYAWGYGPPLGLSSGFALTPTQVDPADLHDISLVAASDTSSYALSADGGLWCWGYNSSGALGIGTTTDSFNTPQHLLPPSGYIYTSISSGRFSSHAVALLESLASLGDINLDGKIDIVDLGLLASHWQAHGTSLPGDLNGDGAVDIVDLGTLAKHWQFGTHGGVSFDDALNKLNLSSAPEPAGLSIALAGVLSLVLKRRRRHGSRGYAP